MRPIGGLSWRLALLPGLVMLVVGGLLFAAASWPLSRDLRQQAEVRVRHDADVLAHRIEVSTARRLAEIRQLARTLERLPPGDAAAQRAEMAWLRAMSPAFAWIGLVSLDGVVQVGTEDWLVGVSLKERPVFQRGREALWFGEFHPAKLLQPLLAGADRREVWVADLGLPLKDANGTPRGVLVAHLNVDWLLRVGDDVLGEERSRQLSLDWILVQSDGKRLSPREPMVDPQQLPPDTRQGFVEVQGGTAGHDHPHLVAFKDLQPGLDEAVRWRVVVAQDADVALAPVARLYGVFGGLALLSLALGFGLTWWASRRVAGPYEGLIRAAQRRFEVEGEEQSPQQFLSRLGEELAEGASPMEGRAGALLQRLGRDAQQMERVLDHLPMGVLLCDTEQRIVYANAPFAALVGRPAASLQGVLAVEVLVRPDDPVRAELQAAGTVHQLRFDMPSADGRTRTVAWRGIGLFGRKHQPDSLLMLVQDLSAEVSERRRADALQRRFAMLVNSARSDGFVLIDAEAQIRDWSQGAEQLSGWEASALVGRPLRSLFVAADAIDAVLKSAAQDGQAVLSLPMRRADGGELYAEGRCYALNDGDGSMALIFSDTTQSRAASERVLESESRLSAVIANASDAIISTDVQGRVILFNPAAERIFQVRSDDMMGQTLERLLPASEHGRHAHRMAAFAQSATTRRPMGVGKVEGRRADGERLMLEAAISSAHTGGRTVLTAVLRDVSDRDRAEQRMVTYQLQLAELTQRLLAQEKETTRRLAQVLHDELGQTLAALRLLLDAALQRPEPPPWLARLDTTVTLANRQVREVLTELRPPLLDEQGLQAALSNELAQQERRLGEAAPALHLAWEAEATQRWSADVEYAAFMIAREAVGNALKHAQAHAVQVRVRGAGSHLELMIEDDGVGAAQVESAPGHLGVVGMRERALAIGARLTLGANQPSGLRVCLEWWEDGQ